MRRGTHVFLRLFVVLPLLIDVALAQEPNPVEQQLRSFFEDPAYYRALWAVKIQSLQTGEVLYEKNAGKLVMPASSMKIVTAFAAVERLGLSFKFETRVVTDGVVQDGSLMGNLVVVGGGDPTLGARLSSPDLLRLENGDPLALFEEWATKLRSLGIQKINGDIIGDDSIFDRVPLGLGWAWDDLPYGYSAEVCGLPYNENIVLLRVTPAALPGGQVTVETRPPTSYLSVRSELQSVPAWEEADYRIQRRPGTNQAILVGTVVAGSSPFWVPVAVDNPTRYFVTVLRETLGRQGIEVTGVARDIDDVADKPPRPEETLIVHYSPDLAFVTQVLLKTSSNLYAESLIRMLDQHERGKSFEEGREEVEEMLTGIGVPPDSYVLADGSGLSRSNLLTADTLVRVLRHVYRNPYQKEFLAALPLSGVDGTLSERMKGSTAQGKVRAKTGSLSNVRALAGYVTTKDDEVLAFAMIVNNYTQPRRSAEYLQDLALEFLAGMKR